MVLHQGVAVRRTARHSARAASAASRTSSPPTRTPAARPSTGRRCTGGWCWRHCAGVSSAATRPHRHLSGQTRSVELAAIGRRVCETEFDLLNLWRRRDRPAQPADRGRTGRGRRRVPGNRRPRRHRRVRSTSTPASPPTCCAPSSANCSTTPRRTARGAGRPRLRRRAGTGRGDPARRTRRPRSRGRCRCLRTLVAPPARRRPPRLRDMNSALRRAGPAASQAGSSTLVPTGEAERLGVHLPHDAAVGRGVERLERPSRRRRPSRICASLTCGPKPRPASDSASTCTSPPGRSAGAGSRRNGPGRRRRRRRGTTRCRGSCRTPVRRRGCIASATSNRASTPLAAAFARAWSIACGRVVDTEHVVAEPRQQDGVLAEPAARVEHPAPDQPGLLECHDRRLGFADHPGRGAVS